MGGPGRRYRREHQHSEEGGYYRRRRTRRTAGGNGCLFYVLVFLGVMLLIALLFGGFHKGHKYNGGQPAHPPSGVPSALQYPAGPDRTAWI